MSSNNINKYSLQLSHIICGVLALNPHDKIFTKLLLTNELDLRPSNKNNNLNLLFDESTINELQNVLSHTPTRELAYILIKNFLFLTPKKVSCNTVKLPPNKHNLLLQNYFKRFNFFYKCYFGENYTNLDILKNQRLFNSLALYTLFFIVGI